MFAKYTSAGAADFKQRYEGTIGWLHRGGKKHLVLVTQVTGVRVTFTDKDGTEYFANDNAEGVEFEFLPVTRGWKNGLHSAWYMHRRPAKQYQRGMSSGNTEVFKLSKNGAALQKALVDLSAIDEVSVYSSTDPLDIFKDSAKRKVPYGVAINRHFAVVPNGPVYFYDRLIGSVNDGRVHLGYKNLQQELSDVIRRGNIPLEIQ